MFSALKAYYKSILPHVTDVDFEQLVQYLEVKHFQKGEDIVKQGAIENHVYFINKGFVQFIVHANGKDIYTGFKGAGDYISSYESFLTRQPATEALNAAEDCEMFALSYDNLQKLFIEAPIFETFTRIIAEKLYIMISQRSHALLVLTPEQRYYKMIENNSMLPQLVPQYVLASYIGVTPEHLSRLRKKNATKK